MNTTRRRRTLRLRTRVTLFFGLTALVASLGLAVVTYAVARSFLIDTRQETARTQTFANAKIVRDLQPVHLLLVGGDCIDGRGEKSGSTELITVNRNEQCQMAAECIRVWRASPFPRRTMICRSRASRWAEGDRRARQMQRIFMRRVGLALLLMLAATALTSLLVARRVMHLDMVRVLKGRD